MRVEDELRLSFYKEIASVSERHGVKLVQHADTGKVYVKKTLKHYDLAVFEIIRDSHFPGVPVIKELIESDDTLIVIEDYISGHSVDELLESGPVNAEEAKRVVSALCDILEPFHSNIPQIVHRDIKGSNVIIDNEGKVYLIDFDASKFVVNGRNRDTDLLGTEEYAAPEQYGFGQSDQRTDIYALGILLNKMLTGKVPSESKCGGDLLPVVTRATAIDPQNRYQNVQALKRDIEEHGNDEACSVEVEVLSYDTTDPGALRRALSHLPYPIRELPGFRSGRPLYLGLALLWYAFLIIIGFITESNNPDYTAAQNKFYDVATFLLLLAPTLYAGNYLGIRDRMPWQKSDRKAMEYVRIGVGTVSAVLIVIVVVTIAAVLFNF